MSPEVSTLYSQIPRSILPHTASLKKLTGIDSRGNATYATAVDLNYVRLEVARKNALTSLGEQRNDSMVLFFDVINSLPAGTEFAINDVVTFGGRDYTVREAVAEYTVYGTPHHYEVALV